MQKYANEKPPLRSELYSADQMEHYGKILAERHALIAGRAPNILLNRLADNEELLLEVHHLLTDAIKTNQRIIPAGEWLLDNFYLIQEQIRTGKKHLPKGYSENLPRLLRGASAGLPRVYDIAIEIISHSDGRVDLKSLASFIAAYQEITPLQLGELWAIPIMLRLALIENLRRLSTQIAFDRINQNLADYWVEQMTSIAEKDPKSLILVIADMARSHPPMVSSFVAELTRQLQGKGPALALPLNWIEQRLSETGQTSADLINTEIQKQAADQVSMSNSIGSLRFLGTMDWRDFVESLSIVDQVLRKDTGGIYSKMDFSTRDHYRHVVEKLSRYSDLSEQDIAGMAVRLAANAAIKIGPADRSAHVGYFLVGKGLQHIEKGIKLDLPVKDRLQEIVRRFPLLFYVGTILLVTLFVGWSLFTKANADGTGYWILASVCLLSFFGASHFAITLVNWLTTLFIRPQLLPRMDFESGIPPDCRTLIIIPTMLTSKPEIEGLVEALEVHFLANKAEHLHFGLLTDFKDAATETDPEDGPLIELASQRIAELNAKYAQTDSDIFFLFHRPRKWNGQDRQWMGYERKRGKLTELNALLRGEARDAFTHIVGRKDIFPEIRYVITIDSDTQLPRDAAYKIIATMAHPLNRAKYDEHKERVTEGYGILQPRVALSIPGTHNSFFARMHGSDLGIDPYTRTTSDVYQDLFDEGSFIGKGIYEVDIFRQGLDNRFPENRILSHDLLEGCYLRSGLLSDVQLYEEYPSKFSADVKRRHRWIRGDWQIAAWILPFIPAEGKGWHKNHLSALSRWKIFDNIRRSLVPSALMVLLLLGWSVLYDAWFWTLVVTALLLLPSLIAATFDILHKPKEILLKQHFSDSIHTVVNNLLQTLFTITCLPYEAYYSIDAIFRTNWRMLISHKHLLEWNPYSNPKHHHSGGLSEAYQSMWIAPFLGLAGLVFLSFYSPLDHFVADPILILWIFSPAAAWLVSRPLKKQQADLNEQQIIFLRKTARRTWAYFEQFVTAVDNWLPPDNYQEHPVERIAHRTSPTNIGLSLMANLAASDFGYITNTQFLERTSNTFSTLQKMERHRGHFYNWYDTLSMDPLPPRYISTVDSGNLVGHLLTLRQGILALPNQPMIEPKLFEGLNDTLRLVIAEIPKSVTLHAFQKTLFSLLGLLPFTLPAINGLTDSLVEAAEKVVEEHTAETGSSLYIWVHALLLQTIKIKEELGLLKPWITPPQVPEEIAQILKLGEIPSLSDIIHLDNRLTIELEELLLGNLNTAQKEGLVNFAFQLEKLAGSAREKLLLIEQLALVCLDLSDVEYEFLYEKSQHLLAIGYNADEQRRDPSFYDLLASEARLSTFVGIAQGKLPQESWFSLGRQLTNAGGVSVLLSWTGSMFEYLMPMLVMPTYENTLLDETCRAMVKRQVEYGNQLGVPWGISESGYNLVDANLNYQYRAFGVPELGLKRGLSEDLVIAPYATVLALMVDPEEACQNMERLTAGEYEGVFGFYEAIDYTPSRLPRGQTSVTIKSYMAHHQGMSLLSLAYLLLDQPMQKRFASEPRFQATLLLLQERIPKAIKFFSPPPDIADISIVSDAPQMRVIRNLDTPIPEVQLLSNGNYHVMVTNAGGGYSRWRNIAVTRWREDSTCDNWGSFCFIRDSETGTFWSTGHQPTIKTAKNYEAVFSQGRAEFRRRDNDIETHTEIVVSPEDDVEIRRVHITNRSRRKRTIELTSYAEVVLTSAVADTIHPAFSNLFVQTQIIPQKHAILCTRRPRSADERCPWMFHVMKTNSGNASQVSFETDRMSFIGRGNSIANPAAMTTDKGLSGTEGPVLEPIVSIQYRIILDPQESVTVDMVYGISETLEATEGLIEKYQDPSFMDRAFELAWTHSQVVLRQINATEADAQLYARLASSVIYANTSLRADPSILLKNHRGQSGLWSYSISGDLPIVLLKVADIENISLVRQLVQAHAYWRLKGLIVDLVIWNEDYGGYRQLLQNQLLALISAGVGMEATERPGGIFVRITEQIAPEDRILIETVARMVLSDNKGTLVSQVNRRPVLKPVIPQLVTRTNLLPAIKLELPAQKLQHFNGLGGFSPDGSEYVITTHQNQVTPLPWVNVIANHQFGTVISESGQSYTWVENAHEFRLTPWNNDPVSDTAGEVFYIRDEETAQFWSPTALPIRGKSDYRTRHGFGYSIFEHVEEGIQSNMQVFVDLEATMKFTVLRIRNMSGRPRKLSVTGYVEWVLGDLRPKSAMHILTEVDTKTGALFAKNPYNKEFNDKVCFFDVNDATRTFTADRAEFIGRNGSLNNPDALSRSRLSGKTGAALDPCGALQVVIDLADNQEQEIVFLLGTGINTGAASSLVQRFRAPGAVAMALEKVRAYWQKTLGAVQFETPDKSFNLLGNGWLMYQTLACRFFARSGFYQSGGAFGFRDQIQDAMAILHAEPKMVRDHILLCASRQFKEGDVQHWWHPPTGRGVRTRCSDDFLWLPYAVYRYILCTGDSSILDESVQFLEGRVLNHEEESYYDLPGRSSDAGSVYNHCVRAIQHGLQFGSHGLPLMGSGDWNDGMDKVGNQGKGESVWLGFFLYDILKKFSVLSGKRNDIVFAEQCLDEADRLKVNIEKSAWDGEWYRRAYFDNGAVLGSAENQECRIDSIAQSWSVLSNAGDADRTSVAMESAYKYLVRKDKALIQLLDPPFDKSDLNPGYIKGYVPGVRENGGQYTHAAIWLVMAFAAMKKKERTWELFSLINPVNHGNTAERIAVYKAEPYVVAADVYSIDLHSGRGGWTWYTGSAGWMYRLILESVLGLQRVGDSLLLNPCIPWEWNSFYVLYRFGETSYKINFSQAKGEAELITVFVDGVEQKGNMVIMTNDHVEHNVEVNLVYSGK
nr:glycoside hydrolase family 94 protein [Flavihumibacter profundi]